jgi:hypothetical protein
VEPTREPSLGLGVAVGGTGRILADPATHPGPKWQLRVGFEPLTTRFGAAGPVSFSGTLHLLALGEMSFDSTDSNEAGAGLRVGYRASASWWRLELGLGVEAGLGVLAQLYGSHAASMSVAAAPRLFLRGRLTEHVSLTVDGDLTFTGVTVANDGGGQSFQWYAFPSVAAGVMVFF